MWQIRKIIFVGVPLFPPSHSPGSKADTLIPKNYTADETVTYIRSPVNAIIISVFRYSHLRKHLSCQFARRWVA